MFPPRNVTGWSGLSRYPSNVSLSELIRLLCALSTLTCWGFISWPVVFLSLQVGFWHNLRSHFPILLRWWGCCSFLYDQINLTGAKGEKKKKNGIKIPLSLSWGAQLHCTVCFPQHGAAAESSIIERWARAKQKWLIFIGMCLPIQWVIIVLWN